MFPADIANTIYGCLGATMFSFYIVVDVQLIVGGKSRQYQYSVDDYVMAALALYLLRRPHYSVAPRRLRPVSVALCLASRWRKGARALTQIGCRVVV